MLGAIIGDIVGSVYEFDNIKTKDFPLFQRECKFTDDTVLTVAVAEWLLDGGDLVEYFAKWYRACGGGRAYGGMFEQWINSEDRKPYNSWGNGSAMRVSACAWRAREEAQVLELAKASAEVTHNHKEGIKGAQATALAIYLAREGKTSEEIRKAVTEFAGYDLSESVDEIREWYYFNETCAETVPQAIICALEATDFEDAIRNAISIGGDSDTVAAITGSVAEAMFGIAEAIETRARRYLTDEINEVLDRFAKKRQGRKDQSPELPMWSEVSGKKLSASEINEMGRLAIKGDEEVQKELMELAREAFEAENFEVAAALYKEAAHAFWFQKGKSQSTASDVSAASSVAWKRLHYAEQYCGRLDGTPKYEHSFRNSRELYDALQQFLDRDEENMGEAIGYLGSAMFAAGVDCDPFPFSRILYPAIACALDLPDVEPEKAEWLAPGLARADARIALDYIIMALLEWFARQQ